MGDGIDGTEPCGEETLETLALWSLFLGAKSIPSCPNPTPMSSRGLAGNPVAVTPDKPRVAALTTGIGKGVRPRMTSFSLPLFWDAGFRTSPTISDVIVFCSCASFLSSASLSSAFLSSSSSFLLITSEASLDSLDSPSENGEGDRSDAVDRLNAISWRAAVGEEILACPCRCTCGNRTLDGDLCVSEFNRRRTPSGVADIPDPVSVRALVAPPLTLLVGMRIESGWSRSTVAAVGASG